MVKLFFSNSEELEIYVTRKLSHIAPHLGLTWDEESDQYQEEDGSFASQLNRLIEDLNETQIHENYHEKEDVVAEYVNTFLNWGVVKDGR